MALGFFVSFLFVAGAYSFGFQLDLNCTIPPPSPPAQDANHLKPSDIKMIFSSGDSITAGFAMHGEPIEYRKDVYAIGAEEHSNTLFNYLKMYNPDIVGGSVEDTLPLDAGAPPEFWLNSHSAKTQLNGAISGAKASDVSPQVSYLAKQMKSYTTVDYYNDWKLFTLFIGANDLCESCYNRSSETPEAFGNTVNSIISQIYTSIPRVAVQLVGLFNISQVWDLNKHSPYCRAIDHTFDECACLYDSKETRAAMDNATVYYNQQLRMIAENWQAFGDSNFSVVYQPCFEDEIVPSIAYLSTLDCFHPSAITDELLANGLWNCMWTPTSEKPTSTDPDVVPICPGPDDYLYT
mmetsp:Transcript_12003/g.15948  ORF Transcript_12003/g.15948 Transcript_12003/m.15948 type:complete len:350 (-) Transcript_12003:125-1174(-)